MVPKDENESWQFGKTGSFHLHITCKVELDWLKLVWGSSVQIGALPGCWGWLWRPWSCCVHTANVAKGWDQEPEDLELQYTAKKQRQTMFKRGRSSAGRDLLRNQANKECRPFSRRTLIKIQAVSQFSLYPSLAAESCSVGHVFKKDQPKTRLPPW